VLVVWKREPSGRGQGMKNIAGLKYTMIDITSRPVTHAVQIFIDSQNSLHDT